MAAHMETQYSSNMEVNTYSAAVSQGYVLPEGRIIPNTVFVGGIDIRMNEAEIRSLFEQYGTVKEVKVITDRTGVSKGYGFVSFLENVDVQKIVEINFHGKKLKLGPAIRKQQNLNSCVHPRRVVLNPPPPQFRSVWGNQNVETYVQPPAVMNPVTPYVQPYPYTPPPVVVKQQFPIGYQPAYNYQAQPQWVAGEQTNYVMPPTQVYPSVNYHNTEEPGFTQTECALPELPQLPNSPQKAKSVDRGMQTVLSCLSNPENQLTNDFVSQDNNVKESKPYHFRKGRTTVHKDV